MQPFKKLLLPAHPRCPTDSTPKNKGLLPQPAEAAHHCRLTAQITRGDRDAPDSCIQRERLLLTVGQSQV